VLIAAAPAQSNAAGSAAGASVASAEVQIGICAPVEQAVQALELRPRGASITVWQFDDDSLTLLKHGLRLRLRVAADGGSELTLKVANQDCAQVDPERVSRPEGKCEYDMYGTSMAGAVSLTRTLSATSTEQLLAGRLTPAQVLSQSQERYLRDVVRFWPLPPEIAKRGPMEVRRYRTKGGVYDVDVSRLPNDEQYVEISRKVPVPEAPQAMRGLESKLAKAGVAMCSNQSSPAADKLRALAR
jgi:hypothetical protein